MFDSNAESNRNVQAAERALTADLERRGATVRIGRVPAEPGVNGPDDFRAAHDDEALLGLIDDAGPAVPEPVEALLDRCGFDTASAETIEGAMRALHKALVGADAIRRAAVEAALLARLKARQIPGARTLVETLRSVDAETGDSGPRLIRDEPAADAPVTDAAGLLDDVAAVFTRYLVCDPHVVTAATLWSAHSYGMSIWTASPLLLVTSPTKRCGKTRKMTLLHALACRSLITTNVTPAVLFRLVDAKHPTLLLDEADTWLSDERAELRGIINGGFSRPSAAVARCVGDDHEVRVFSTWAAKAIGMIGRPSGSASTLLDRSIVCELQRRLPGESVARLREDLIEDVCAPIRARLQRWVTDHAADWRDAEPTVPRGLDDRAEMLWHPLLVIAETAGGNWPALARAAAVALSGDRDADTTDAPIGIVLLADLRDGFGEDERDVLPTADLLTHLKAIPERPWLDWGKGKGLTAHALAKLLRAYHCHTDQHRVGADQHRVGDDRVRGYRADALRAAWDRYAPRQSTPDVRQRDNPNEIRPIVLFSERDRTEPVSHRGSQETLMKSGPRLTVSHQAAISWGGDADAHAEDEPAGPEVIL